MFISILHEFGLGKYGPVTTERPLGQQFNNPNDPSPNSGLTSNLYTEGERILLKRVVFTLLTSLVLCGCFDAPEAPRDGNAASAPESITLPNQPSAETKTKSQKIDGPRDVIFEGHLTVDVMEIVAPPRANELGQRLQQAARANPDWWLEHAKKAKPGEPLPYDMRLGLSEAEYSEFLTLIKKMATRKKTEASLIVATKDEDVYVLDGGKALPDFTGIEIDLNNDVVRTPFGVLTERSKIDADEDSALGAWVGVKWYFEKSDPNGDSGTVAELAIGQLKQCGRCVIYYDVKQVSLDGKTRISHILNYDLPQ